LTARDLVKSFGVTPALREAGMSVNAGEVVAVLGPSGSGKSTLLHCLAGILTPDAGRVCFDGSRIDDLGERARSELRRRRFGFVFQSGQLVPELSAIENVMLPLLLDRATRSGARAAAAGLMRRLDLDGLERRKPGELSGGQAQRVAVARALIAHPDVIFADEPTGSLDTLSGENVMELLLDASREQGATVILVTHDPRVAAYADREVVVRDGRVTALAAR
jgi:putative ABC transport system ATP-binding protein